MMLCNALTESASAEISFYVDRSDWWTPENDATRGSDLNGSRNYHSGTNKRAARQIKHGRRPTGTVVRRSEQTASSWRSWRPIIIIILHNNNNNNNPTINLSRAHTPPFSCFSSHDESCSFVIQCVSLFLQAVRVTKPHIPESVLRNYELMWVFLFKQLIWKWQLRSVYNYSRMLKECGARLKLLCEVAPNGSFPVLLLSLISSYKPRNAAQAFNFCTVPCTKFKKSHRSPLLFGLLFASWMPFRWK